MNKTIYFILRLLVLLAFIGLLLSVIFDWGGRFELICCTATAVGTFILFKNKKKRTKQ